MQSLLVGFGGLVPRVKTNLAFIFGLVEKLGNHHLPALAASLWQLWQQEKLCKTTQQICMFLACGHKTAEPAKSTRINEKLTTL